MGIIKWSLFNPTTFWDGSYGIIVVSRTVRERTGQAVGLCGHREMTGLDTETGELYPAGRLDRGG